MKDSRIFQRPKARHPGDYLSPEARALVEAVRRSGPVYKYKDRIRRSVTVDGVGYSARAFRECKKKGALFWARGEYYFCGHIVIGWREDGGDE